MTDIQFSLERLALDPLGEPVTLVRCKAETGQRAIVQIRGGGIVEPVQGTGQAVSLLRDWLEGDMAKLVRERQDATFRGWCRLAGMN